MEPKAVSRDGTEGVSGVQVLGGFDTLLRCLSHRQGVTQEFLAEEWRDQVCILDQALRQRCGW